MDLPPVMYVDHKVPMAPEQQRAYDSLQAHLAVQLKEGLITAVNEGAKRVKLMQISCGAIYDEKGDFLEIDAAPKFKELEAIIKEAGNKLILFVPFRHITKIIAQWVSEKYGRDNMTYGVINGGVGTAKRNRIFEAFQHGDLNLIIAHPAAMAHGLTLTATATICWWSPVESYKTYEQANGRITRPGQTQKQYIKHLICSTIEEEIYTRLKNRESMQGILLDMIKV